MVKQFIKMLSRNLNALEEICRSSKGKEFVNRFHSFHNSGRGSLLLQICYKISWLLEEGNCVSRAIHKEPVEQISAPLDTVLNLAGKVSKCAHRYCSFRRVSAI